MLNILGHRHTARLCDGIPRRDFLRAGTLAVGGLTLPQLLQAEAASGVSNSKKAVIMIYMCGAPGHQDMYDLKMNAPVGFVVCLSLSPPMSQGLKFANTCLVWQPSWTSVFRCEVCMVLRMGDMIR